MNQIEEMLVVKRSGELVKFDSSRIINAVNSCMQASTAHRSGVALCIRLHAIAEEV